jgi:ADP-ribose diphosphatase
MARPRSQGRDLNRSRVRLGPKVPTYDTPFMQVYRCRADFGSATKDYYVIQFKPRAGVVITRGAEVLLVRQYRFLPNRNSWELPGGSIEPAESARSGVVRECVEETGIRPLRLSLLVTYYPGLDNVDNCTRIYHAARFEICAPFTPNPLEVSALRWLSVDRAVAMIRHGRILDAMTVTGLLAYASRGKASGKNAS